MAEKSQSLKYDIEKWQTNGVVLSRSAKNGKMSGKRVSADEFKDVFGVEFAKVMEDRFPTKYEK